MITDPLAENYSVSNSESETPLLRDLREATSRELKYDDMLSGPVTGAFLKMLVMLSGARNVLEIGTFTGYGTLWMAMGLPPDGYITTCECNEKYARIAHRFFERFQNENREHDVPEINMLNGPALETLPAIFQFQGTSQAVSGSNVSSCQLDMIFIDADKEHYPDYYNMLLPVLRPGGLMVIDNAFWGGKVWNDNHQDTAEYLIGNNNQSVQIKHTGDHLDRKARAIDRLNRMIYEDPQVQNVLLTVRDGLHLVRKK